MRRSIVLGVALLVAMSAGATTKVQIAQGESVMTLRVDGQLAIDPEGRVLDYKVRTKLAPQIEKLLAKAVPQWRFQPVLVDGKPVAARTPMRITLAATEIKGGYEVRVDNVVFSPNTEQEHKEDSAARRMAAEHVDIASHKLVPPGYPQGLMRAGVEGLVLLNLRLNPDGSVAEALAVQSSLLNVKGKPELLDRARVLLEKSALAAARNWSFRVDAKGRKDLTADELSVSIPVDYRLSSGGRPASLDGQWRIEFRGPRLAAPWLIDVAGAQEIGVSDLDSGEMTASTSKFKLQDKSILGAVL